MRDSQVIVTRARVLMECRASSELANGRPLPPGVGAGGCGKEWIEVDRIFGRLDYWGRRTETLKTPPRCPHCNGWNYRRRGILKVTSGGTSKCRDVCQESESLSCRCSCGGKMHGAAIRRREQEGP